MNSFLLNRQLGSINQQTLATAQNSRLLRSLQAAPRVKFAQEASSDDYIAGNSVYNAAPGTGSLAHGAGVSSIAIDRFEGRYLLSGGADSSVAIWDLEANTSPGLVPFTHSPADRVIRTSRTESLGITHVSYFPFDSYAFLTSGYDHSLKLFSVDPIQSKSSFDLGSVVYSHSVSTIATHLLVACATQHPTVRLVDLQSGSSTHSLAGHSGSVLAVAWHPRNENILASGATDGSVRLWDIRRSASSLGVLDMEDNIGVAGYDGKGTGARRRERGKAHSGAVNGLAWTENGQHLVTVGHDERMRVWNVAAGSNTLANFGPALKNANTTSLYPLIAPSHLLSAGKEVVYFPNPREVLGFDLHAGTLLSRLRVPAFQGGQALDSSARNLRSRTTSLTWRAHGIEMYSAHADGTIRCWRPRTLEDVAVERDENDSAGEESEAAERKRKREELDKIVQDLTGKRKTYS